MYCEDAFEVFRLFFHDPNARIVVDAKTRKKMYQNSPFLNGLKTSSGGIVYDIKFRSLTGGLYEAYLE